MDLDLVSVRLAELAAGVDGIVRSDGYTPDAVSPPHFYVGEYTIAYDQTYGGLMDVEFICRLMVSRADDRSGQAALKAFTARTGPTSVKAALEGSPGVAQTLGGACDDLHVRRVQSNRLYRVGESATYVGAEWVVRVIGTDSEE